jgi:DNA-binding response OmpR family regulator
MSAGGKKRILIADDDPGMRLALLVRLRAHNFEVSCAGDGLSTIFEARKSNPDLIILDLGLPSGDGFTVLEMLNSDEDWAGIPIIVLSGMDRANNQPRAEKAGAWTFLQKPVDASHLLSVVNQALKIERRVPSSPAK